MGSRSHVDTGSLSSARSRASGDICRGIERILQLAMLSVVGCERRYCIQMPQTTTVGNYKLCMIPHREGIMIVVAQSIPRLTIPYKGITRIDSVTQSRVNTRFDRMTIEWATFVRLMQNRDNRCEGYNCWSYLYIFLTLISPIESARCS